jgi:monoamine oxidase
MEILRKIFGPDIPRPHTAIISNWTNDPLFRCTYTAFAPGVPADIFEDLLKPVGRLYFAGESLNNSNYGFTQGAYGSGVNVAKLISSELRASSVTTEVQLVSTVVTVVLSLLMFTL